MKDGWKREKEMKSKLCEKVCYRKKTVIKTVLNNMFFVIGITAISHSQYDGSAQGYVWVILSPVFFFTNWFTTHVLKYNLYISNIMKQNEKNDIQK